MWLLVCYGIRANVVTIHFENCFFTVDDNDDEMKSWSWLVGNSFKSIWNFMKNTKNQLFNKLSFTLIVLESFESFSDQKFN